MKKIFSVILAAVMMLTMTTGAFAASFEDTVDHTYAEAIDAVNTLGIIAGYGDDKFGPDDDLTRAQMVTMLVRAAYDDNEIYYGNTTFTDVPLNHWARVYIDTGVRHGVASGYGNGAFGPEDNLTYTQAARMLLNVLGYGDLAWPEGVNGVALQIGLYDDMRVVDYNAICSRGAAAQMIYNAFDANLVRSYAGYHSTIKNTSFLADVLGYVETTYQEIEGADAGHKFVAYMPIEYKDKLDNSNYYKYEKVTETKVTWEDTIYFKDYMGYYFSTKANAKEYDEMLQDVDVFVNGEIYTEGNNHLAKFISVYSIDRDTSVIGIFEEIDNTDTLIAIQYSEPAEVFIPGVSVPSAVQKDKSYDANYSVVEYFDKDNYTITNEWVSNFVYDVDTVVENGITTCYVELNDGSEYEFAYIDGRTFDANDYIIIHFDSNDDVAGYTVIAHF